MNGMSGLKFLASRWASHKIVLIITLVLFAGMMAAVIVFHTDPAAYDDPDADYLMCKLCGLIPMITGVMLPGIFLSAEVSGNRFIRAIPAAEKLFRRDIPLFGLALNLGWGLLSNGVYAAFILISGRDSCNISDMLLLSSVIALIYTIGAGAFLSSRAGAALAILSYLPFLPYMAVLGKLPEKIKFEGFGIPVWGAALIFCGAYVLGTVISAVISGACWRRGNFREPEYGGIYNKQF